MAVLDMHPLNHGFSWTPASPPYRRITPEQAASFDEQGYFVVDDAFDRDGIARLLAEIDPMEEQFETSRHRQREPDSGPLCAWFGCCPACAADAFVVVDLCMFVGGAKGSFP